MPSIRTVSSALLPADRSPRGVVAHGLRVLLSVALLAGGLSIVLTALATIGTWAWPQPTYDQFRLYPIYLEQPFPDNVLQRENQHRPIVPGLVRVAEIHWFAANQWLQIGFGLACAVLTAGLVAFAGLRASTLPWPVRAAAAAAAGIGVFWLGNARMLMHGNELVHAYLLTLCVVVGAFAVWRARGDAPLRWMGVASAAGCVATFCFGPGIAAFPAFALAAWCARVPRRGWLLPLAACVACLVLYVAVLPDGGGVRNGIALRPFDSVVMAARLLSSPWINAWLGFGEPAYIPLYATLLANDGAGWLPQSADAVQQATGLTWRVGLAVAIGFTGLAVLAAWLLRALVKRDVGSRLELVAATLMLFGAASMLTLALGRLDYLEQQPNQVFADRYLVWPCLFWLGAVLMMLVARGRVGQVTRPLAVAAMLALPWLLWPTHKLGAGWSATVYRANQTMAAAARSDVIDPEVFWREDPSADWASKLRSLELFRERHLAMFATPGADAIGTTWSGSLAPRGEGDGMNLSAPVPAGDVREGRHPYRFFGVIVRGALPRGDELIAVLDAEDRIVGYGEVSFHGTPVPHLRKRLHPKRGFDAFIRGFDPGMRYRVVVLDFVRGEGRLLGEVRRAAGSDAVVPLP